MAIVQISQITNRKGLQEDLPDPLAGGELGWSIDERRLFIGNGTLAEGAPVVGNTELLTEFSNIPAILSNSSITLANVVSTGIVSATGNISTASNLLVAGNVSVNRNLSAIGNISSGNITTAGLVNCANLVVSGDVVSSGLIDGAELVLGSYYVRQTSQVNIPAGAVSNIITISNTIPAAQVNYSIVSSNGPVAIGVFQVVGQTTSGTYTTLTDLRQQNSLEISVANISLNSAQVSNATPIIVTANNISNVSATMTYSISYFS